MKPSSCWISTRGQYPKNYGGKNFRQKKKPTGCPRFDPLFGCCPWTMTSNEVGDCPIEVSTLLSHGVSPWVRTKDFVYPVLTPEALQKQLLRVRREAAM